LRKRYEKYEKRRITISDEMEESKFQKEERTIDEN
jgi:hypothetical protein